jgi:hypothetical protein
VIVETVAHAEQARLVATGNVVDLAALALRKDVSKLACSVKVTTSALPDFAVLSAEAVCPLIPSIAEVVDHVLSEAHALPMDVGRLVQTVAMADIVTQETNVPPAAAAYP